MRKWLKIRTIDYQPDPSLKVLDRGELEAIYLAEPVKANRLIIDDLDDRREAESRNLSVTRTLGILAEAARRDLLDLAQALAALQTTNFHVAPALIQRFLDHEANRRKKESLKWKPSVLAFEGAFFPSNGSPTSFPLQLQEYQVEHPAASQDHAWSA